MKDYGFLYRLVERARERSAFLFHFNAGACNGCDILIHEVYSRAGFDKLPPDDQKYHAAFHTSAPELAALATRARAKTLVLHHQLFFGQTESELLGEVKRGFRGNLVSAHDLQTL